MTKKSVFFLVLVTISVSVGLYYYNFSNGIIVDEDDRNFSIETTSSITELSIIGKARSINLLKEGGDWKLNKKHVADAVKMKELLRVVSNLEVKRRVAKTTNDSLVSAIKTEGVRVLIKNGSAVVREYFLGNDLKDSSGVYLVKKGAELSFIGYVLGEKMLFNDIFSTELNDWKSKVVFSVGKNRIENIILNYVGDSAKSFRIETKDNDIALLSQQKVKCEDMNVQALVDYLSKINVIESVGVVSLEEQGECFFDLSLEVYSDATSKNDLVQMKGYRKIANQGQRDFTGKLMKYDDEYFVLVSRGESYQMNYFSFENILLQYSDFVK